MKKLICILMAAMMLMLCGCGSEEASSAADSSSAAKAKEYSFTKKCSIDNVSFCVPEDSVEQAGDNGIMYYYFPDAGFIMTTVHENSYAVSVHNESQIDGLIEGLESSGGAKVLDHDKTFIGDTPILLIRMKVEAQSITMYCYSVYLNSDRSLLSLGVNSYDSFDDAKAKCDALIDTIQIDERAAEEAPVSSIFTKRIYDSGFSFCVPENAYQNTTSSGNKGYEGSEAIIMSTETSYGIDLDDDAQIYEIFGTFDFERTTVNGVTVIKVLTKSEGKYYGWVIFYLKGTYHTIGVTSKIDAVTRSNVKGLLDDFFKALKFS